MDIRNQLVGEKMQVNPRKIMQKQITELYERVNQVAGGISLVMQKLEHMENTMRGLEEITMKLSEFLGKRDEFNKYIQNWLEEEKATEGEALKKDKAVNSD